MDPTGMPPPASDAESSGRWIPVLGVVAVLACRLLSASSVTTLIALLVILIGSSFIPLSLIRRLRVPASQTFQAEEKKDLGHHGDQLDLTESSPEPTMLAVCKSLASALPGCVIFPHDTVAFEHSMNSYWAQQEREVAPACVVRPQNIKELSDAVKILKREYDERQKRVGLNQTSGLFAIRSGGHSPVPGAASIKGGVMIDLSLFCEVSPSKDGSNVVIGTGARWMDVSKILDEKGLAVVGGRNAAVGVGGLVLGGGLSFFTPRYGPVCSNIISYELVLASGSIITVSASTNPDLWRALKGGSNNFGIVTRFTARSFPSTKIWSGFLYIPSFQALKVLAAFHESVNQVNAHESLAAGPMVCFSYIQPLGIQLITVNLVHTRHAEGSTWPVCWSTSPFRSIWRLWSTCRVRTLSSATDELNTLSPYGSRQVFATTTIKNDHATITATHAAYNDAISSISNVKGMVWTLVLQPLLPEWMRKGDANPLGFDDGTDDPLINVGFTINWSKHYDDEYVKVVTRKVVERIDAAAAANGTGHRYRYLNYCEEWQKPFESYGEENWRFLKDVSKKYDPEGLFQKGCIGGFKLDVDNGAA